MSRGAVRSTRPAGTLARQPIEDLDEALDKALREKVDKTAYKCRQAAYNLFGYDVEPYYGAESQAKQFMPWYRLFVDVPALPPLNFCPSQGRDEPDKFSIGCDCPECGEWIAKRFSTLEALAGIRVAPVVDCDVCKKLGVHTLVNVWTGERWRP